MIKIPESIIKESIKTKDEWIVTLNESYVTHPLFGKVDNIINQFFDVGDFVFDKDKYWQVVSIHIHKGIITLKQNKETIKASFCRDIDMGYL